MIHVQICYARPDQQILRDFVVAADASLQQAIEQSGFLQEFPEIDLAINCVGIFGKIKALAASLHEADRIEIYGPLIADPKEARRRRADKK